MAALEKEVLFGIRNTKGRVTSYGRKVKAKRAAVGRELTGSEIRSLQSGKAEPLPLGAILRQAEKGRNITALLEKAQA